MCGRAILISSSCIAIISCCAKAAESVGSLQDQKMFVQPGILDAFVERLFENLASERQTTVVTLGRIISSIQLNQELVEMVILKYKLHKYILASSIKPIRTEAQMKPGELFAGMKLPPCPQGPYHTLFSISNMGACILFYLFSIPKPLRNALG